jgi:hypothetical protein
MAGRGEGKRTLAGRILLAALLGTVAGVPGWASEGESPVALAPLLEEAEGLAREARALHAQALGMGPSAERNEVLSKACRLLKAALDKYGVASEASAPSERLRSETADLRGILFWCHKSMVIVVPEARPVPPSGPTTEPVEEPAGTGPAPAAPSQLAPPERAEVQALLAELTPLFEAHERHEDEIASCRTQMQDVRAVLAATRAAWEGRMSQERRGILPSELAVPRTCG